MKKKYFAVYEKVPSHGSTVNGIILGPYDTEEKAQESGKKYGYTGSNYYVGTYRNY